MTESSAQNPYIVVLVTAPSQEDGDKIARALVDANLAACVSITPVTSIYTWENQVHQDQEWQLMIKTKRQQFSQLAAKIHTIHPFEVPEIIAVPIVAGSEAYLNWIADQVGASSSSV